MFIIRDTATGQAGAVFKNSAKFTWLTGETGFNAYAGLRRGDQQVYVVSVVHEGEGDEFSESQPVYNLETDTFTITRTRSWRGLTEEALERFKNLANIAAEQARLRFLTPGGGKMMSYRDKLDEAVDLLTAFPTANDFDTADPAPAPGTWPILESEVGHKGNTAWEVADLIHTTYQAWKIIEGQINATNLQAKVDLDAATTEREAEELLRALSWPEPE